MSGLQKKVRTCFWFNTGGYEAAKFYTGLVPDSQIDAVFEHGNPADPMVVEFTLAGAPMMILTGGPGAPAHAPSASISILTKTQAETDRLWSALIADGGEESMCGWLKDKYGVSWQVVPEQMPGFLGHADREKAGRAMAAMMTMRKLDIGAIEAAFNGEKV
jgi:predicted 3-demethylubiquinone-9 3-methyltransferase (glyoxalase superfamily)